MQLLFRALTLSHEVFDQQWILVKFRFHPVVITVFFPTGIYNLSPSYILPTGRQTNRPTD
jgi:hypothetical protein